MSARVQAAMVFWGLCPLTPPPQSRQRGPAWRAIEACDALRRAGLQVVQGGAQAGRGFHVPLHAVPPAGRTARLRPPARPPGPRGPRGGPAMRASQAAQAGTGRRWASRAVPAGSGVSTKANGASVGSIRKRLPAPGPRRAKTSGAPWATANGSSPGPGPGPRAKGGGPGPGGREGTWPRVLGAPRCARKALGIGPRAGGQGGALYKIA